MSFIPVVNNEIPEAPMQMILVITENYRRYKILARFAPNLTEKITSYKKVIRG
jgi:hypothetical protein